MISLCIPQVILVNGGQSLNSPVPALYRNEPKREKRPRERMLKAGQSEWRSVLQCGGVGARAMI